MATPTASPLVARPKRTLLQELWRHRLDYLYISPFYIIFGVFGLYPLGWALWLSFHQWSGFGDMQWVGLDNYSQMLAEENTYKALVNSLVFTALLVPSGVIMALFFGVVLNINNLRGRGVFRVIYFLPFLTSTVIVGIVFASLLDDTYGWINGGLKLVGLDGISWLRDVFWAKISIIILTHWHGMGYNILITLGGLQSLPGEVYEAADIDGASAWQKFWRITVPLMRPVMLFITITGTIGVLEMFQQPYILTKGGPEYSTMTMTYRLYELAFQTTRFGDGAALGYLIAVIIVAISLLNLRLLRSWRD